MLTLDGGEYGNDTLIRWMWRAVDADRANRLGAQDVRMGANMSTEPPVGTGREL